MRHRLTMAVVFALWAYVIYAQAPQTQATRTTTAAPTYANNTYNPLSTDTSGNLRTAISATVTIGTSGLATSANQTNGTQRSIIVDAGNEAATVTGGGLDVNFAAGATVNVNFLTASPNVSVSNTPAVTISGQPVLTAWVTASPNVTVSAALPTGTNNIGTVTGSTVTANFLTANIAVNLAQVAGATVTTGVGTATGAQRVANIQHDGTNVALVDPCQSETSSFFNIQTTVNAQVITGTANKRVYLCSFNVVVAAATNVALVAGTGSVCATTTVAVPGTSGGATAATGWNFAANGGIALGNGATSFAQTTVNGDNVCIFISAANQTSGGGKYVVR